MAEFTKEEFFKHLDNLTVLDLADYIKEFEDRYGIKAEMAAMPAAGVAAPAAAEEEAEEKTEFDIILKNVGPKKINVIKVVREVTDLGLKEAKAVVDAAPETVKKTVPKEEAEEIKKKFEEVGAEVEIK
ncbi:MAG: 50S ribosomal protein L7/L12 [Candidatus Aminicenantes bacterium]|nr:50S ribosomal protein L7/L12 [Candidatus Aminicenantes bacterium]NIM79791.1 50S ribosomal protein L7/L12 [Candidatus Aminicenantes bacterium]NIN19119.1 50S ribosomal protein L7/L12 [Candidatus Aminicenantes bacterium]NIN43021.1 50S ribosomal protein L7/L12 [Candidatus Aminicenantes bacterium]NIN85764.1 50S ribosomal protein L7/L12 [Candidatus Aminicenantes bacterium]